jgi:hypothetical protein
LGSVLAIVDEVLKTILIVWEPSAPVPGSTPSSFVSLRPYIRRLIVTAQDSPTVMLFIWRNIVGSLGRCPPAALGGKQVVHPFLFVDTTSSFVSLRPYIRRLIVTAQDSPTVMQGFFGGDWETQKVAGRVVEY